MAIQEVNPEVARLLQRAQVLGRYLKDHHAQNKILRYYPDEDTPEFPARHRYPKQMEFFRAGRDTFARLLMCGNGFGKTEGCGGYEMAWHMRGQYPDWWEGHRFDRPIDVMIGGDTFKNTRDILQAKLLGQMGKPGTGIIPYDWVDHDSIIRGTHGTVDTFRVKRADGGYSYGTFKTYEQGVEAFFGVERDLVWFDEIVPLEIYAEGVARTRNRKGARVMVTFTPKKGRTPLVKMFLDQPSPTRRVIKGGWDSAPHLDDEYKANIVDNTPPQLMPAVRDGEPTQGAGAVYPVDEAKFVVNLSERGLRPYPAHWRWIGGFDGGFYHTAYVLIGYDADLDRAHVVHAYCDGGVKPNGDVIDVSVHATRIKMFNKMHAGFEDVPIIGDAAAVNQTDGKKTLDEYRKLGVRIELADKAVDAGTTVVLSRLNNDKLWVSSDCEGWLQEFRGYHREYDDETQTSVIRKQEDHRMDATRYPIVKIKKAKARHDKGPVAIRTVGIRR